MATPVKPDANLRRLAYERYVDNKKRRQASKHPGDVAYARMLIERVEARRKAMLRKD